MEKLNFNLHLILKSQLCRIASDVLEEDQETHHNHREKLFQLVPSLRVSSLCRGGDLSPFLSYLSLLVLFWWLSDAHCQIGPENFDIEKWQIEKGPFYKMGPISGTTYDFKKFNTSFYRWNNGLPDATLKFWKKCQNFWQLRLKNDDFGTPVAHLGQPRGTQTHLGSINSCPLSPNMGSKVSLTQSISQFWGLKIGDFAKFSRSKISKCQNFFQKCLKLFIWTFSMIWNNFWTKISLFLPIFTLPINWLYPSKG